MADSTSFYVVRQGDTLGEVARCNGITVEKLCRINAIHNPDLIQVGQVIALTSRAVCKVRILLLDWDRNPIPGATMQLKYCGKLKTVKSRSNGLLPELLTETPDDIVEISIRRYNGTWEKIAAVPSGSGNKLITLRSPKLKIETETKPHPKDRSGMPILESTLNKSITPPSTPISTKAEGKPQAKYGEGKGPKAADATSSSGLPRIKVTNDQEKLPFLEGYSGEKITEEDYLLAARKVNCEVAVIKSVAEIESNGEGFDKRHRPVILYERHVFARRTTPEGRYDKENPDISALDRRYRWPDKNTRRLIAEGRISANDLYGNSYQRLAKAYALDKTAALEACSWGRFQILGENYRSAGFSSVTAFVEAMCISEKEHLQAFVNFVISNPRLRKAACRKDWRQFAMHYNGAAFEQGRYHIKMQEAYERYAL